MKDIEAAVTRRQPPTAAPTLPFGADKWGRDVIKKTIKGSRDVDLRRPRRRASSRRSSARVFGALAGYYGRWVDDLFNWFYSVFTSIPYLLLILAVAAVLQQKGTMTIVLILGLTGWTGMFRLIRAEYMKHKAREYVQAADAIGASNCAPDVRAHLPERVSHVALVQLSILVVALHQVRGDPVASSASACRSTSCRGAAC